MHLPGWSGEWIRNPQRIGLCRSSLSARVYQIAAVFIDPQSAKPPAAWSDGLDEPSKQQWKFLFL